MDAAGFFKYSKTVNVFCQQFMEELAEVWGKTSHEVMMDIGCGPGNNSTYWMDHYFPDIERLIGIDFDPKMVTFAKENNTKEKIEFCVADITKKDDLKEWEGGIDKIVSTFVLQRVSDQKQALRNVFDLLKPTGEAAVYFHMRGLFYLASMDLAQTSKWKSILKIPNSRFPEAQFENHDLAHYKKLFEDVGFRVSVCEERTVQFPWKSDEDVKDFVMSLNSIGDVSEEMKEEYKTDIFKSFLKFTPRNSEGQLIHRMTVIYAKLCKDTR